MNDMLGYNTAFRAPTRVVSSFLAAIAQMWKLGVDGGAGT